MGGGGKECSTKLTVVPVLGFHPILPVLLHLVCRSVITVGQALLNKLIGVFKALVKEVRREGEMIRLDLQKGYILLDHLCAKHPQLKRANHFSPSQKLRPS